MVVGPVEYIVVGFPGNKFKGEIIPELISLVESRTVRILDLVFISKDSDGVVVAFEIDEMDELVESAGLDGEFGGLISPTDIEHAASSLEPNSSAALLIWEDLWAIPFATALRKADGVLLEGGRIPHEIIEPALSDLPPAI
jgi:Family of unknown function (DUF6325)